MQKCSTMMRWYCHLMVRSPCRADVPTGNRENNVGLDELLSWRDRCRFINGSESQQQGLQPDVRTSAS